MKVIVQKLTFPIACHPEMWPIMVNIRLTGRWKLRVTNGDKEIFVEQKGWVWNSWIPEGLIKIKMVEEYVNNCKFSK